MVILDKSDPNTDYRRLAELAEEFFQHWKHLQALYLDSVVGFSFVRQRVEDNQAFARKIAEGTELDSQEFQDTRIFSYREIFKNEFVTSGIHQSTQGEARKRNAHDGDNFITLGQLCVTSFYDYWEEYLRREYIVAKGKLARDEKDFGRVQACLREFASFDIWGDVYYLRNAIVHHRGIATSQVEERTKCLKWFKRGEKIAITPERMRLLLLELLKFRNQLYAEQFPPRTFRIAEYDEHFEES